MANRRTYSRTFQLQALELDISDDGQGMTEIRRAGVGLNSIYERAAELGGPVKSDQCRAAAPLFTSPCQANMDEDAMDKISVLLADDHPPFRAGLRALLESEPDIEVIGEAQTGA